MNFVILPSLSQLMSASVARRVGRSFSRARGMIGNNAPIAQWSGSVWNTLKFAT